jgi:hypothetical protein
MPPRRSWPAASQLRQELEEDRRCAASAQQTQTLAAPQPVDTHRQQLAYATGIPSPKRPTPPHPHPPHPARRQPHPPRQPARAKPHPGPRQPKPATRAPRHPHPPPRHPHPPPRHPNPPTRATPTLPKAAWPPPQPRPPQRAEASLLESATMPPIAAMAAMIRIILRNIGVSPFIYVLTPTVPPKKRRGVQTRTEARGLHSARHLSTAPNTTCAAAGNSLTIEPAWREDA